MQRVILLVTLGTLSMLACAQYESDDYQATMLLLPEGEPDAGRTAFLSLGCASCHTVAWDPDLPAPVSATPGPQLGLDVDKIGPGGLATSIVAPSHKVAEEYRRQAGSARSPMTDYTRTMTIRQLADLVAYLQRQGLETKAKGG